VGKRYQRFLRAVTGDRQPASVVCLTVEGRRGPDPDVPSRRREELQSWSLVRWRTEAGRPVRERHIAGQTAEQFWWEIGSVLSGGATTWLFSPGAVRDMTLLGLWERIETGEVYFDGADHRDVGGNDRARRDGFRGYCVLEDPPTVVLCRVRGKPGLLKWLDTRNYGIPPALPTLRRDSGSQPLVQTVRGVTDALSAAGLGRPPEHRRVAGLVQFQTQTHGDGHAHPHEHRQALDLERASYVGGRCECFRIGPLPPPVYHLDYRALYGWVMREHALPVRLRGYRVSEDPDRRPNRRPERRR
jgi:hypothetical protein